MSMSRRPESQQQEMWVPTHTLPEAPGCPFYTQLNQLLAAHGFDRFVESRCAPYYAQTLGRPSIAPGVYFRMLLIGYFEGLGSERGIAWRVADSLSLRRFLGYALSEATPDHSSLSRIRQRLPQEVYQEVFNWVLGVLAKEGLLKGKTLAVDATTLEANAALRNVVRRDTGPGYREYHAVDLDTQALVAVQVTGADEGDTASLPWTLIQSDLNLQAVSQDPKARIRGTRGRTLQRRRAEYAERSFAHTYESGGLRRTHLRGHANIYKRLSLHGSAFNLGLAMRKRTGCGTPRGLRELGAVLGLFKAWRQVARGLGLRRRPLPPLGPGSTVSHPLPPPPLTSIGHGPKRGIFNGLLAHRRWQEPTTTCTRTRPSWVPKIDEGD